MKGRTASRADTQDTIAAIITPPGEGGIAAVRVAGSKSRSVLARHFSAKHSDDAEPHPFLMRLGYFKSLDGEILDEVMAVFMPEGRSYTGLEQIEIFCHGGRQVVKKILDEILKGDIRAAEPGEFTRLAFENGRIDLSRAEAVAEIIAAETEVSYRASREHLLGNYSEHIDMLRTELIGVLSEVEASIDFTEDAPEVGADSRKLLILVDSLVTKLSALAETYRGGRIISEGYTIVIGGRPNAGKSSLFNLLLRKERALVTPTPGTTRDYLLERIDLDGYTVNLIDTAGLRQGGGKIEREGQRLAKGMIAKADLVIWVVDLSKQNWAKLLTLDIESLGSAHILLLGNKIDIVKKAASLSLSASQKIIGASCKTGIGLSKLHREIVGRIEKSMPDLTSGLVVTSARHRQKLKESIRHLRLARTKIEGSVSPELVAYDLRTAVSSLGEITGKVYTEQVLGRIFSRFCIGK
ncbi:MAG: tRNA uridine-5-carboxymethylaminomethyl(34) synthesis GTPase MnmE [candidate division Zixibacteria bacterium]|nr:tRNA uridine-5-carboxymethylaminomethyl(34) synthesis GTPase MnmE [candidate division Zixibacteria bacterium]